MQANKASLKELQQDYGLEDLWVLVELIMVENHNTRAFSQWRDKNVNR